VREALGFLAETIIQSTKADLKDLYDEIEKLKREVKHE